MVSIVCPVYNKERYISHSIQSVIGQTCAKWELLLVDDGSTDRSFEVAKTIARNDSRIQVIRRNDYKPEKKGANVCRNIGVDLAKGEFIIFLDADDIMLPHCVEQRLGIANSKPEFDLYVFNVAYSMGYDTEPFSTGYRHSSQLMRAIDKGDERRFFLGRFLSFDLPWHTSGPLWRRESILTAGGFDENFERLQDPEIHARVLLDKRIRICSQIVDMPYDLIHLKDESRVVWSSSKFYDKQIDSVEKFINKLAPIVKQSEGKRFVRHLQGYLLFAETLSYRYVRDSSPNLVAVKDRLKRLYDNQVISEISNPLFRLFIKLFRITLRPKLISFKVPGFFLLVYKKMIFR